MTVVILLPTGFFQSRSRAVGSETTIVPPLPRNRMFRFRHVTIRAPFVMVTVTGPDDQLAPRVTVSQFVQPAHLPP